MKNINYRKTCPKMFKCNMNIINYKCLPFYNVVFLQEIGYYSVIKYNIVILKLHVSTYLYTRTFRIRIRSKVIIIIYYQMAIAKVY